MAARKGSDMLLYLDTDGNGTYQQVAGVQNVRVASRRDLTDITNQQSTSKHREGLEGASIFSMTISGSGVMLDGAPLSTIESYAMAGTLRNWRCVIPGGATYTGKFALTQFERQGQHNREVTYSLTLESAGVITAS